MLGTPPMEGAEVVIEVAEEVTVVAEAVAEEEQLAEVHREGAVPPEEAPEEGVEVPEEA